MQLEKHEHIFQSLTLFFRSETKDGERKALLVADSSLPKIDRMTQSL